ncbi:hypothetical protein Pint_09975 [Pistacia integerrima]|uniref:Uncharacterized protein n=1 Tax=Pistacia integerrima TaxID=434235 RepID=A0ACC0XHM8_9ROSI|nr:hypothetical protein Pint_09975 [Pistacia integerrima]
MATQQLVADNKQGAEVHHGAALCKQKCHELLAEFNLPKGLLPLDNLTEMGYNRATGFMWVKQNQRYEHKFKAINRTVSYDTEVSAYIENRRMRKVTGVKVKELLMWVRLVEMYIDDPNSSKVTFSSAAGLSKTFPISAFELEEKDQKEQK